ncbi:ADP-ribosylglycohydrolase family protein [Segatella hominis]|uniref:ADP-ribosylglycohydrolase family protein n=1 Tax=Segatella hominis TaxID=2518605 RepID=UPI003F7FC3A2
MENETIKERFLGTIFGQVVGDADTNAAVAGAILGAKFGICHIPEEWRNGLLYASMLHDKVQEFYAMYR